MPPTPLPRRLRALFVLLLPVVLAGCYGEGEGQPRVPGTPPPTIEGVEYELVFADEFDSGTAPSSEKWNIETGYGDNGWGNNEWQLYTDSPDNVRVEDGNLVISALCPTPPCGVRDGSVTSARINTLDKFEFRYGRVEARLKPPVGKAAWPAFWSLGANFPTVGWPRSGEIDFMEMFSEGSDDRTTHFTMHWEEGGQRIFDSRSRSFDSSLGDDFHIYEAEWNEERIIGRIDGIEFFNRRIDPATMQEFRRDFYLILNVAMGGTLGSGEQPPDGTEVFPQTMLVDYVRVYQPVGLAPDGPFEIDFEDPPESYNFGPDGGFEGGAAAVVANPVPGGINTSAQVARMLKFSGAPFAGSRLELPEPLDVEAGSVFTMKVWSPRPVRVLFKLEGPPAPEPELDIMHGGTGWEEMTFDFSSFAGTVEAFTFIFDNMVVGDAGGDPDNWTFYFDDIALVSAPPPEPELIDLPITFDEPDVDYTVTDFGEPVPVSTRLVADPDDASNTVASTTKPPGAPVWAGTTMSTPAGLATPIPFTATETTIGVRVWSPDAGIPVRLKAENVSDSMISVETEAVTTVANAWETLVFDFANEVEGPPLDPEASYSLLAIFFNFGTDGDTAGEKTYLWDDVEFGVEPPDTTPPAMETVTMSSSNMNPALAVIGDVVTIRMVADEPIARPTVTINGVSAAVTGALATWRASRALTAADAGLDGMEVGFMIDFADVAGNPGETVNTITEGSAVTVDATAPGVMITSSLAEFVNTDPFPVTFAFTEAVTGFTSAGIEVDGGTKGPVTPVDGATYMANITPFGSVDVTVSVAAGAAADLAGNPSLASMVLTIDNAIDADVPTMDVSIASSNANPAYARIDDEVTITMTASEPIDPPVVFIAGESATVTGSSDVDWQASRVLTAADAGLDGMAVPFTIDFQDVGGTPGGRRETTNDGSTVTFDISAPTLTIDGVEDPVMTTDAFPVTFTFSEAVEGFDASDLDAAVTNGSAAAFAGSGAVYTAEITPAGAGTLTITIAADAATDAAGNGNAETSVSATVDLTPFWQPVWSDTFNDTTMLDPDNWTARTDADCPPPCDGVQTYLEERVAVIDDRLIIEAQAAPGPSFSSGVVDTRGWALDLTYGRIEIDAKLPAGLGSAPSLWLVPVEETYGPFPQSGAIDIVNAPDLGVAGSITVEQALHYGLPEPEDTETSGAYDPAVAPQDNFLTYAIEWEAGEIRWFVDGEHVLTQTQDNWYAYSEDAEGVYMLGMDAAPFDRPFYLAMGLAIDDSATTAGFPRALEVDEVRVFRCANSDPATGAGCSTGDPGVTPVTAPGAPYAETLPVYVDAPATLDFVDSAGMTTAATLVPGTLSSGAGVTVTSTIDAPDDSNFVWNVNVMASTGSGGVFMGPADFGSATGFFDLSGGETAGELLFRMRVNGTDGDPSVAVRLDGGAGSGTFMLDYVADGSWQQYSVKIADLVADAMMSGPALDLDNVADLFTIEAAGGSIDFDLDDIEVKVVCRDTAACEATARVSEPATEEVYSQDFEALDAGGEVIGDGWRYFVNVYRSGMFRFGYGGDAPNGPQMSALVTGEGGTEQGLQQFSVYSDYDCCPGGFGHLDAAGLVETNIFQEPRPPASPITASEVGQTWTFSFDAKRGNIEGSSEAFGFFKVLNPSAGFSLTELITTEMTAISPDWMRYSVEITIGDWEGQVLQFGFFTNASNFEGSGIFYDNIEVTRTVP